MSVVAGIDLAWHDGFLLQLQLAELSDEQLDGKDMRAVLREFVGANEASRLIIERARALRGFIDHRIARALDARAGVRPCGSFTPHAHVPDICHACGFMKSNHKG